MLFSLPDPRSPRRRGVSSWWTRWVYWRLWRRSPWARWGLAGAPVAALLLLLAALAPGAWLDPDAAAAWDLAGKVSVAVVTAMIGHAMLRMGRWL